MLADAGILTFNATLVFELVVFVATATFLWKMLWGPLTLAMAARQDMIEAGLRAAEESERRLVAVQADVHKALEQAREQARDIIARAHREAAADAEASRDRNRREGDALIERARGEITVERERAIGELRTQVGSMVVAAAGQVLGHAIDEQRHRQLIDDSLKKVNAN